MDASIASLALLRLEGLGPGRYWQLVERFGSAEAALQQPPHNLSGKLPERARTQLAEYQRNVRDSELGQWALAEYERASQQGIRLLHSEHAEFPPLLKEIKRPPPLLYVRGDVELLALPQIAVVGARRASRAGLDNALAFSADLAAAGFAITSGLALGVDAAAHRGALKGAGKTVAVLGTGVDRLYPRRNVALAEEILANGGAVVSEMPLAAAPEAANFPRRNRIIAALSLGLVVVEAAMRSGSLISARLANELGRLVFAVPGSPLDPRSEGTNSLLKNGAIVTTSADDVISALAPLDQRAGSGPKGQMPLFEPEETLSLPPDDDQRAQIVSLLGPSPVDVDDIIAHTGIAPAKVFLSILELDLAGRIERHSGNRVSLLPAVV